jgi:hypothetical protein
LGEIPSKHPKVAAKVVPSVGEKLEDNYTLGNGASRRTLKCKLLLREEQKIGTVAQLT